ncbi:phage tail protein [Pseudomonas sessilinigenes]|uniref:Phage tail protein n=1 Tax=Pseudomonas sessilinigenes TaxID=658629 RepID=A0ABX8MUY1_9PSED|nr:phage tail protein [Pseudomonas sessilinigenes]AZC22918.1 Phage tail fiber protein [Pseudomonas sessilinigenes]QXH41951.1 phage tail protein [Pseudomonas sessilinigenes]
MIDSNSQFFATLTALGEAKQANATALGIPWTFKEMAVGDANGTDPVPNKRQTKLINEWRRAPVNQVRTDPANPNVIITEQVIPPDVGGHWIREIGLFDADGDLVAVANCAPTFKPLLAQGTGKTQIIRMNFIVSNTAQIVLKIDPSVVLATRQYVDDSLATALPANKAAGTYRQVTIDKRGVVLTGTNPTTVAGYGITDAYTKPETTAAIQQAVAALVASAPGTLDTLKELADALGNDPNFATTMTNALAAKANKATTLGGYGIVDGATKSDLNSAVSGLLPKAGGIVSGPIYLANGTGDSPEIAWKTPELEVYADVINRTLRFFSYFNGQTEFPLVIDVPGKSASFFGSTAWHSGNFNPQDKANKSSTLTGYGITDGVSKNELANELANKVSYTSVLYNGPVSGTASKLKLLATGQNAMVNVSFEEVAIRHTDGNYRTVPGWSGAVNLMASGANGLDIGVLEPSRWYSIWMIEAPGVAFALLASLSDSDPVMPPGYTGKARLGYARTDGTANRFILPFIQMGKKAQYTPGISGNLPTFPLVVAGIQGTVNPISLVPVSVTAHVPPGACSISMTSHCANMPGSTVLINPNGSVAGDYYAPTPLNHVSFSIQSIGSPGYYAAMSTPLSMCLQSTNIYVAINGANSGISITGWELY